MQRATERTKLLLRFPSRTVLAKYAGLGHYGREKLERATALAEAGFAPPVLGLAYGFLLHPFLQARPLTVADLSPELLARMVEYYAFLLEQFRSPKSPRFSRLAELIVTNARGSLDLDASDFVESWRGRKEAIDALPLVRIDGRPQPHEWLLVESNGRPRLVKADASDHFYDHTLVAEQSILWDLAGSCEEWAMDDDDISRLLALWRNGTGDRLAATMLNFYRAAYLAFRLGALHYAVHGTDEEDVRRLLQEEEEKYKRRLRVLMSAGRQR